MVQRMVARQAQNAVLILSEVVKYLGLFGVIAGAIVVLMWRFYDKVWLYTLGYPWTEWMRDHLLVFWVALFIVSAAGAWWMWHSVTKALDSAVSGAAPQQTSAGQRRFMTRLFWAIYQRDLIKRRAAGTMVSAFFLFGLLGFVSGHVIWGGGGVQQGHLSVGPGGQLYLTDPQGDSVLVSRPDGSQGSIGGTPGNPLQFHTPRGLLSDPSGQQLYVVDTYHQRIVMVDPKDPANNCVVLGKKGTGPGQFHQPSGIALQQGPGEGSQNLYIFDGTRRKVVHFKLSGQQAEFVKEWGWKAPIPTSASPSLPFNLEGCTE